MRRVVAAAALVALAGCQGDDGMLYDDAAKAEARRVAPTVPFGAYGRVTAVGQPVERPECPEAPSFRAGRCLDVPVTNRVPALDRAQGSVPIRSHVYVWLEKRGGRWVVTGTSFSSEDVTVEVVVPNSADSGSSIPPWTTGPSYAP